MGTTIRCTVNEHEHELTLEPRELLLDVLRDHLGLTGAHGACEQGACGACTVLVDGVAVRSCLMLGVQADGTSVTTIEGVADGATLHPLQAKLSEHHGLQCGFCTPGIVLAALELLERHRAPDRGTVERELSGNLCRCTGYTGIVDAIVAVGEEASR